MVFELLAIISIDPEAKLVLLEAEDVIGGTWSSSRSILDVSNVSFGSSPTAPCLRIAASRQLALHSIPSVLQSIRSHSEFSLRLWLFDCILSGVRRLSDCSLHHQRVYQNYLEILGSSKINVFRSRLLDVALTFKKLGSMHLRINPGKVKLVYAQNVLNKSEIYMLVKELP